MSILSLVCADMQQCAVTNLENQIHCSPEPTGPFWSEWDMQTQEVEIGRKVVDEKRKLSTAYGQPSI